MRNNNNFISEGKSEKDLWFEDEKNKFNLINFASDLDYDQWLEYTDDDFDFVDNILNMSNEEKAKVLLNILHLSNLQELSKIVLEGKDETLEKEIWWDQNWLELTGFVNDLDYDDWLNFLNGDDTRIEFIMSSPNKEKARILWGILNIANLDGIINDSPENENVLNPEDFLEFNEKDGNPSGCLPDNMFAAFENNNNFGLEDILLGESNMSFKGNRTNDIYVILKDLKDDNVLVFADGEYYSTIDLDELRNDLDNNKMVVLDEDGKEHLINVSDIEFISVNESNSTPEYINMYFGKGYEIDAMSELRKALPELDIKLNGTHTISIYKQDKIFATIQTDITRYGWLSFFEGQHKMLGVSVDKLEDAIEHIKVNLKTI